MWKRFHGGERIRSSAHASSERKTDSGSGRACLRSPAGAPRSRRGGQAAGGADDDAAHGFEALGAELVDRVRRGVPIRGICRAIGEVDDVDGGHGAVEEGDVIIEDGAGVQAELLADAEFAGGGEYAVDQFGGAVAGDCDGQVPIAHHVDDKYGFDLCGPASVRKPLGQAPAAVEAVIPAVGALAFFAVDKRDEEGERALGGGGEHAGDFQQDAAAGTGVVGTDEGIAQA